MSYFKTFQIDTNNGTGDAFGRVRGSQPEPLFDSKQLYDDQPLLWDDQEVSGSGTSSTHSTDEAATTMTVGATTAGKRVRQTFQRFNYQPGMSQFILATFSEFDTGTDITKEVGYFDDNNGIFLRSSAGTVSIVRRSNVTGTPVEEVVNQSSWTIDPMDGSGNSAIDLDWTKNQILVIDFEWLGVGRVRVGFNVDGVTYYVHEFVHANILDRVYMSSPNLPIRYSIENGGTGATDDFLHICSSVVSEGGVSDGGVIRSVHLGANYVNANAVGTFYALIGLRLKSTHISATIKPVLENTLAATSDNYLWELRWNPTVAGTFTYNDQTNSAVQVALGDTAGNPSTNTVTGGIVLRSGYAAEGSSESTEANTLLNLGAAIDGTRDELVLCVTPLSSNLDVTGSLTWREIF